MSKKVDETIDKTKHGSVVIRADDFKSDIREDIVSWLAECGYDKFTDIRLVNYYGKLFIELE